MKAESCAHSKNSSITPYRSWGFDKSRIIRDDNIPQRAGTRPAPTTSGDILLLRWEEFRLNSVHSPNGIYHTLNYRGLLSEKNIRNAGLSALRTCD